MMVCTVLFARMTVLIYHDEPYIHDFDATVISVQDGWIELDRTAFYPGGGGQEQDRGSINGFDMTDLKKDGDRILHHVPKGRFEVGSIVECKVDWNRRYDLMRGHTGEHLLFSCLSRTNPELQLIKISITTEKKSLILNGALDWESVHNAEKEALEIITEGPLTWEENMSKDDPALQKCRVKLEKVHGESVRVVHIGEYDSAACSGIHVKNVSELKLILVTKFVSARPAGDYEVEFEVGEKALGKALELSVFGLRAAERIGAQPADMLSALDNMKKEELIKESALKKYGAQAIANLVPSHIGDIELYSGSFEAIDKRMLMDGANGLINAGTACIIGSTGEHFTLLIAAGPDVDVDCVAILNEALSKVGGRGGGKKNFATGGSSSPDRAEEVIVAAIAALSRALEKE